jgi:hypothetical protein
MFYVRFKNKHTRKHVTLTTKKHAQRALRSIHIGLPRHNSGWLVFVPSNNTIYHSIDVYFDEHFESTNLESNRYPGYVDCVITPKPMKTLTSNALGLRYGSATRKVYQVALSFRYMHNLMSRKSATSIFTTTTPTARMPHYQSSFDDTPLPPTTPYASTALHSTLHFTV